MKMSRIQRLLINRTNNRKKLELVERMLGIAGAVELDNALEIGSGAGFVAAGLNRLYGMSVDGVDVDPEQVRIAKERSGDNERLRFHEADAQDLPFEDEEFDLVLSQMVLHHVPEWDKALEEITRVLRRGRIYIFDDAVYTAITRKYLRFLLKGHSFYSQDEVLSVLRGYGMQLVHQEELWGLLKFLVRHSVMVFRKQAKE
jgi:ubiquinone/menaquinone biosynthesis C-methylase UbiE